VCVCVCVCVCVWCAFLVPCEISNIFILDSILFLYRHEQAKAFATQYGGNTQVKGSVFDQLRGATSGGALGGDVTGKPMWGNPISADRASSTTGRRARSTTD
jgi:hypothetical protein